MLTDLIKPKFDLYRHLIEVQNSTLSIIVGAVFLIDHGRLYDRFPDTYQFLEWLPAALWGFIYLSAGTIHLLALTTGARRLRKYILLIKGGLWVYLATCVIYGDKFSPGGYFYLVFAVIAFWSCVRIEIFRPDFRTPATQE